MRNRPPSLPRAQSTSLRRVFSRNMSLNKDALCSPGLSCTAETILRARWHELVDREPPPRRREVAYSQDVCISTCSPSMDEVERLLPAGAPRRTSCI